MARAFSGHILAVGCSTTATTLFCIDNFSTGTRRNIEDMLGNRRFEVLPHNVTFPCLSKWTKSTTFQLCLSGLSDLMSGGSSSDNQDQRVGRVNMLGLAKRLRRNDSGVLRRHEVISPRDEVNRLTGRFYGEVLRMVIWPEATSPEWRQFLPRNRRAARAAGHGSGFLNPMTLWQTKT